MSQIRLIIAASGAKRAAEIAHERGLPPSRVVLMSGPSTLERDPTVPLYVDPSWSAHPLALGIQEGIARRMAMLMGPARPNQYRPRTRSSVLN